MSSDDRSASTLTPASSTGLRNRVFDGRGVIVEIPAVMLGDIGGRPSPRGGRTPANLPPPRMDEWSWQVQASCHGYPSEVFFPDEQRGVRLRRSEKRAKLICRECPVLNTCRKYALNAAEPYGIWGAMTARERWEAQQLCGAHRAIESSALNAATRRQRS